MAAIIMSERWDLGLNESPLLPLSVLLVILKSIMNRAKDQLDQAMQQLSPLSNIVIGRTGAGKDTPINAATENELAATGSGFPINRSFKRYPESPEDDQLIILYDSMGYDIDEADLVKGIDGFLDRQQALGKEEQSHLAWSTPATFCWPRKNRSQPMMP